MVQWYSNAFVWEILSPHCTPPHPHGAPPTHRPPQWGALISFISFPPDLVAPATTPIPIVHILSMLMCHQSCNLSIHCQYLNKSSTLWHVCVSSNGYVLGEIDHLYEGGGVGADLNDRGRGGVHHLQVKDKDGPSQLDKISMTGRFSSMQVELQEISVWLGGIFVKAYLIFWGEQAI